MSVTPKPNAGQHRLSGRSKEQVEQVSKDFKFFRENYVSLLAQYPNQWIAVLGEQVAASDFDYFEAEAQLKTQGIAHNEAIWEFMAEDKTFLVASNWDLDDD